MKHLKILSVLLILTILCSYLFNQSLIDFKVLLPNSSVNLIYIFFVMIIIKLRMIFKNKEKLSVLIALKNLKMPLLFLIFYCVQTSIISICYSSFKTLNGRQMFLGDSYLNNIDVYIHGGIAWLIFVKLIFLPKIVYFLDDLYSFWFIIKIVIPIYICFFCKKEIAFLFLYTDIFIWLIGGALISNMVNAAGPCFAIRFNTDLYNQYNIVFTYLNSIQNYHTQLECNSIQNLLWNNFLSRKNSLLLGISAFPSLHVAQSAIYAFILWEVNKIVSLGLHVFTFLILIGSVILGWHYAIDGYFAYLFAFFVYFCVKKNLIIK